MKKSLIHSMLATCLMLPILPAQASPDDDLAAFQNYFKKRFPDTAFDDYINGVYAIDKASREQWEAIEEFPPYEINIDNGKVTYEKAFANGKTYASCFGNDPSKIKAKYPLWDERTETVRTLEEDINACRTANNEEKLKYKKGKIADITAYLAFEARGQKINIIIPNEKAEEAYNKGKQFFYAKRGQLNMSCADCHSYHSGNRIRADILSPALGHLSHFPVYRSKWGGLGTPHRRYAGCNKQVRAMSFKAQSEQYKNLEYFHSYMSNGLELNGPGSRK